MTHLPVWGEVLFDDIPPTHRCQEDVSVHPHPPSTQPFFLYSCPPPLYLYQHSMYDPPLNDDLPSTLFLEAPPLPYIHLLIHSSISVWIFIWCSSYAPFPAWCFSPNMFVFLNMVFILSSHKRECTRTCDVAWNQFAYSCVPCIHA